MSGNFQKYIDEHLATLKLLQEQQEIERKKLADEKRVKAESRKALMLYLERFMDASIKFGSLNSSQVELYLTQIRKEYGDQAMIAKYIAVVTRLLTHAFYGVESTTFRPGNGGLIYKGQSYKNSKELYEYFVSFMADFDPLDSQVWFDYVLKTAFDDPTYLPAEVLLPEWRTRFVPQLQQLVEQEKNSVQVPDMDNLTTDDLFIIQSLTGGF